jgi:hypothetical protein
MLDGFEAFMVVGTQQAELILYQTNLILCRFPLGVISTGTPFGAASGDSMALASSTFTVPVPSAVAVAAGNANRFIMTSQLTAVATPTTALIGTISAIGGGGDIQAPSLAVTLAAVQRLNTFTIRMATNGAITVEASLTLV